MKLFKSLLLGVSIATFFADALPFSGQSLDPEIAGREDIKLLPRTKLFAPLASYNKGRAIGFAKDIPLPKLQDLTNTASTLHSGTQTTKGKENAKKGSEFRIDNQGTTSSGYHNLQIQKNGTPIGQKTTVGGILVKGNLGPKAIRKHLVHAVMHPAKDRNGNEYMRKYEKYKKAPTDSSGRKLTNNEARKKKPREPTVNQKSKKTRKAARKASYL